MEPAEIEHRQFENNTSKGTIFKIFLLFILILGFIIAFFSGYFLRDLLHSENGGMEIKVTPTPTPRNTNPDTVKGDIKYLPGKHYFDDTIMLVTKQAPHISLIATVTRIEGESSFTQNNRVSYFDGSKWTRKTESTKTQNSDIKMTNIVKSWATTIDSSRVLKEKTQGEVDIDTNVIEFSTDTLQNELSIRSIPGYTKFMSEGKGKMIVNGTEYESNILYTRIYSLNASDIQFYNQTMGVTTDWMAFWDDNNNFYHIDMTNVDKPTDIYKTHQLGILKDSNGRITKVFTVSITRNSLIPPTQYSVTLSNPIGSILKLNLISSINKAPNSSYVWYMGLADGEVTNPNGSISKGYGLIEYIHD